jgi:hypothetical protein
MQVDFLFTFVKTIKNPRFRKMRQRGSGGRGRGRGGRQATDPSAWIRGRNKGRGLGFSETSEPSEPPHPTSTPASTTPKYTNKEALMSQYKSSFVASSDDSMKATKPQDRSYNSQDRGYQSRDSYQDRTKPRDSYQPQQYQARDQGYVCNNTAYSFPQDTNREVKIILLKTNNEVNSIYKLNISTLTHKIFDTIKLWPTKPLQ